MADVLMMGVDNSGSHPFTYKQGMVVDIYPDGQLGPGTQQHPSFVIVRVPGVTKDELQFLLEGPLGAEEDDGFGGTTRNVVSRRRDKLDKVKLPAPIRSQLDTEREITLNVTAAQIQAYVTRIQEDAP
jgi:hypothetical protein